MELKDKIKDFPIGPGVYRFIDKSGAVLYIGRATNLRRRLTQYFRSDVDSRIAEMVGLAHDIKYKETSTVFDSIILEANLIKKHWPKYNVKDKDNRSFVYVVIPQKDFSFPMIIRERELSKFPVSQNKIFGPYQNQSLIRIFLKIIRRIFPYGTCRPNSGSPCFDYQLGLCPGSCIGEIDKKNYQKNIKNISLLLAGQKKRLLNKLARDNKYAYDAIKHIQDVSLLSSAEESTGDDSRIEAYDVSHLSGKETYGAMAVFIGGKPDKSQYRLFKIKEAPASDDLKALSEVIIRRFHHPEWPRPDLILIDGGKPQVDFIAKTLNYVNISLPIVGISKFAGDRLIFPAKTKKTIKDLAVSIKKVLLQARDEAHRFSNRARKSRLNNRFKNE